MQLYGPAECHLHRGARCRCVAALTLGDRDVAQSRDLRWPRQNAERIKHAHRFVASLAIQERTGPRRACRDALLLIRRTRRHVVQ